MQMQVCRNACSPCVCGFSPDTPASSQSWKTCIWGIGELATLNCPCMWMVVCLCIVVLRLASDLSRVYPASRPKAAGSTSDVLSWLLQCDTNSETRMSAWLHSLHNAQRLCHFSVFQLSGSPHLYLFSAISIKVSSFHFHFCLLWIFIQNMEVE